MGIELTSTVALAAGAAWASGINLYAAVLMMGILGSTGSLTLPSDLEILTHPLVITAAGFMYCVEFFADKMPGVDTGWDVLHTFIRIPAGATLVQEELGAPERLTLVKVDANEPVRLARRAHNVEQAAVNGLP